MLANDNKAKGKRHARFMKRHPLVKKAKDAWIAASTAHMKLFYTSTSQGLTSVESGRRMGIDNIRKWRPLAPETKAEYVRLHALATAQDLLP